MPKRKRSTSGEVTFGARWRNHVVLGERDVHDPFVLRASTFPFESCNTKMVDQAKKNKMGVRRDT